MFGHFTTLCMKGLRSALIYKILRSNNKYHVFRVIAYKITAGIRFRSSYKPLCVYENAIVHVFNKTFKSLRSNGTSFKQINHRHDLCFT